MPPQNRELAALKQFLHSEHLEGRSLRKLEYFSKSTDVLPNVPAWFSNAVFISFDMRWCNELREESSNASPTELGFAVMYGEDVIDFVKDPNSKLEDLFAEIRAFHFQVVERCHMVNSLYGCVDEIEGSFSFGATGFLSEEEAEEVIRTAFTEESYQEAGERRPLILIGQDPHQAIEMVGKKYGIDIKDSDIVDLIQTDSVALGAGVVGDGKIKGLKQLIERFGLGPAELWYMENVGNEVALTLIITLLVSLNQTLHPFATSEGYPPKTVEGRSLEGIIRAAMVRIKRGSKSNWQTTEFCERHEEPGLTATERAPSLASCEGYGSDHLHTHRCLESITNMDCSEGLDVHMEDA
ncbi:hypothetical protein EKO04_010868 [Ascochyta lentis]|uniref:Gfd2/YDR514C-like C-terminal domain-containing protein n=1 Tax=Ascochyta lentis TaxID=205686 RepID=A0A8H7ISY3_9PLEO|nr:hypothetical protein EKO04_010868 [Ascochyta lentis]